MFLPVEKELPRERSTCLFLTNLRTPMNLQIFSQASFTLECISVQSWLLHPWHPHTLGMNYSSTFLLLAFQPPNSTPAHPRSVMSHWEQVPSVCSAQSSSWSNSQSVVPPSVSSVHCSQLCGVNGQWTSILGTQWEICLEHLNKITGTEDTPEDTFSWNSTFTDLF